MSTKTTLVTEVHVTGPDSSVRMRDVGTTVDATPRRTTITFAYARSWVVAVTLTEAERIALIEALGGTR